MSTLTLAKANEIIAAALAHARSSGYKPMGVVVLDASGHPISAQRDDGASMFRIDIATGKAWAAVGMGANSRALRQRAEEMPVFMTSLAATAQGKFLAQTGAVLIKAADGTILGAAGASGGTGDEDEAICAHGAKAAGFRVDL